MSISNTSSQPLNSSSLARVVYFLQLLQDDSITPESVAIVFASWVKPVQEAFLQELERQREGNEYSEHARWLFREVNAFAEQRRTSADALWA